LLKDAKRECEFNKIQISDFIDHINDYKNNYINSDRVNRFTYFFDYKKILFVQFNHIIKEGLLYRLFPNQSIPKMLMLQSRMSEFYSTKLNEIINNHRQKTAIASPQSRCSMHDDLEVYSSFLIEAELNFSEVIELLKSEIIKYKKPVITEIFLTVFSKFIGQV
jgi:hypothetical protein